MKKLITILLILNAHFVYCQFNCRNYCLNFEDTACLKHLSIDTTGNPTNIWQIGRPQKALFDSAVSPPKVIITDSINSYPVNNNSSFVISNQATAGDVYGFRWISGNYNVQTDSLRDYGIIEFSPDKGKTWIDIIKDTTYNVSVWYTDKPVLTGNSHGWKNFDLILTDIGSVFNIHLKDTLLFRFTFRSDSIHENLGGLMYDNLCFRDFVEGISEIHFKPIKSKIYPNPSANIFTINFDNSAAESFQLSVYSIQSKLLYTNEKVTESKVIIDTRTFEPGIYVYKLTNLKAKKRSWGKFVVAK